MGLLSACTPSMNAEQTLEPMMTGRNCMKEAGRSSEQNHSMPYGKRSMKSGARDQPRGCPSGLVSVLARSLEILKLLKVKKVVMKRHQWKKKRRRRKKRRSKNILTNTRNL